MAVGNNLMNDSLSEDTCMSSLGSTSGEASDDEFGSVQPTSDRDCTFEPPLTNNEEREIVAAILEALNLVDQMQGSRKDFVDVLEFAEKFSRNGDREDTMRAKWPKSWRETEMILKKCGYSDPQEYYICLDPSHYSKWDIMLSSDDRCKYCGKSGSIKYYYLGLPDKIKRWCSSASMCTKMMAHWENKDHWIRGTGPNFTLTEVWDGSRFNELSWFWNPECSWMLPFRCTFCSSVISAKEIQQSAQNGDAYHVQWYIQSIF